MAEMRPSGSQIQDPCPPSCDPAQELSTSLLQTGVWCEKCNNRLVELKRQVLRLILPEIQNFLQSGNTPNAGSLSSRIFSQIRLPDTHLKSWLNDQCQVCSTHLDQLKWEAVSMVHTLEESQFLAYYNIPGYVVGPNADQLLRRMERERQRRHGNATADHGDRGLLYARPEDATSVSSFFHRAAQKLNLSSKKKSKRSHKQDALPTELPPARKESSPCPFPTKYKEVLRSSSPPVPPALLKNNKRTDGKVKVMLRICPSFIGESASAMKVDTKRKQVTLYDPSTVSHVSTTRRKMGVAAPKMFAFDAIYEAEATQTEVCSGSLVDILQTVVNGSDGCLFTYGHVGLGKTFTMMGRDESDQTIGVLPCALAWLFRLITDQKQKTGTKFSVRVSAVEIVGRSENWRDLLLSTTGSDNSNNETPSPSVFLQEDRRGGVQLLNPSELRASSAEKAGYYLDAALAARTPPSGGTGPDASAERDETENSHMFFTVHIYRVEKRSKNSGVHGGRSRLHLIDLASCDGYKKEGGASSMSLAGLGNVIIALINGAKHVPHKGSKITRMLQESIGNTSCRTTMIAHVSPSLPFYAETLATSQLASRLHRLRKRKGKGSSTSSSGGESSCDESRIRKPRLRTAEPRLRTTAIPDRLREDGPVGGQENSEDCTSSTGEESCDTVIYVGPDGALSDRELTDNEGPPPRKEYSKSGTHNASTWADCESTRSLREKLDSIEKQDQEDEGRTEEQVTSLEAEEEKVVCVEQIEESFPLDENLASVIDTKFDDDFLEENQELDSLAETLDKNYSQDEDFEFKEDYPVDLLPNFATEREKKRESQLLSENVLLLGKGKELSEKELKETAKYALSKTESLLEFEADNNSLALSPSGHGMDLSNIMRYHKPSSSVIHVDAFPSDDKNTKPSRTSRSNSSEASSSDAESIVLPEKPRYSFMTCDAINDENEARRKRASGEYPDLPPATYAVQPGNFCEVTAKLVEACQPKGYFCQERSCYIVDEQQHSPDEFYFDDTELIWGEKEDDTRTVTVCYEDDQGQGIEKTIQRTSSEDSFPDLDEKLYDINLVTEYNAPELTVKLGNGSDDSFDSDPDLPPRSPAMDTPMTLFYHLVPSPQSSSNEDEVEEGMTTKAKIISVKSLSPIPECPSRESSLNKSSDSLNIHEKRNRDSHNYSVLSLEIENNSNYTVPEGERDRDVTSPPAKYFRTVEHVSSQNEAEETEGKTHSPQKHELRLLLKRFVAEQLRECQEEKYDRKLSQPKPVRPSPPIRTSPNGATPRRGNRRCRVISPSDTAGQDILLPPLMPQRRAMSETARVIRSPKLNMRSERSCGSDIVCYGRDMRRDEYHDDSSDSSLTAKTEPWSPQQTRRVLFPSPVLRPTVATSVTFLGCEDDSSSKNSTKVRPIEPELEDVLEENDVEPALKNEETPEVLEYREQNKRQDTGYQSEPEVASRKGHHRNRKQNKHEERGYVSENECRRSKNRFKSSSSFVRLTYVGSEMSESEADVTYRKPRHHYSEPRVGRYSNLNRPAISRESIKPRTPYAPQNEFKTRHHQRSTPKLIYRLSGDFLAAISTAMDSIPGSTVNTDSKYTLSIEPSVEVTSASIVQVSTSHTSPLPMPIDVIHSIASKTQLKGSTSTLNSGMVGSTSTVWILSEPAVSCGEITADEHSVPGTPGCDSRGKSISKLRLFSRDRSSYSSGHASDSSVSESPGSRQSRNRSLKRSKSAASTRSDAASSSGYESMRNDTSHASSDSCSERGSVMERRKPPGFRRKRSSSAPPSNRRSRSPRRWFSRKSLDEHIEIKVYHVDDMDKLQKFMRAEANEERYQQIHGLRQQQGTLKEELRRSKQRLIDDKKRWSYGLRAEGMFPNDDPRLVEALEMENVMLEKRINTCKSHLMMLTSFDVMVTEV